jgi:hypothetical protein
MGSPAFFIFLLLEALCGMIPMQRPGQGMAKSVFDVFLELTGLQLLLTTASAAHACMLVPY